VRTAVEDVGREVGGVVTTLQDVSRAAETITTGFQILDLRTIDGRPAKLERLGLFIRKRQVESVPEAQNVRALELLLRVRRHLALTGAAHAIALLGMREDHRRWAAMRHRGRIRRMDLHQVVTSSLELIDLLVCHVLG